MYLGRFAVIMSVWKIFLGALRPGDRTEEVDLISNKLDWKLKVVKGGLVGSRNVKKEL